MVIDAAQGRLLFVLLALVFVVISGLCLFTIYRFHTDVDRREIQLEQIVNVTASTHALVSKLLQEKATGARFELGWLDEIEHPLCQINDQQFGGLERCLGDASQFLHDFMAELPETLIDWRSNNTPRIQQLLTEQELQRRELKKTEDLLRRARATILSLRSEAGQQAASSNEQARLTRTRNAERARHHQELAQMQHEMSTLRERLHAEIARQDQINRTLMGDFERLQMEKLDLEDRYQALEKNYQHALQEKTFIEEAFMKIDRHLESTIG